MMTVMMMMVVIGVMIMMKIDFDWYGGYKKQKAQKVSIKEGLLPVAWNPSRYWDWCM